MRYYETMMKISKLCLFVMVFLSFNRCTEKKYYLSKDKDGNKMLFSECELDILGRKDGRCIDYTMEGDTMGKYYCKNGEFHGSYITFFENDKIQTKCFYKKGMLEGLLREYYKNGQLSYEIEMKENMVWNINGVYDSLGVILNYGYLVNGEGLVKVFYPDGSVERVGNYRNGSRNGWWLYYTNTGVLGDSLYYKENYKNDIFGY